VLVVYWSGCKSDVLPLIDSESEMAKPSFEYDIMLISKESVARAGKIGVEAIIAAAVIVEALRTGRTDADARGNELIPSSSCHRTRFSLDWVAADRYLNLNIR